MVSITLVYRARWSYKQKIATRFRRIPSRCSPGITLSSLIPKSKSIMNHSSPERLLSYRIPPGCRLFGVLFVRETNGASASDLMFSKSPAPSSTVRSYQASTGVSVLLFSSAVRLLIRGRSPTSWGLPKQFGMPQSPSRTKRTGGEMTPVGRRRFHLRLTAACKWFSKAVEEVFRPSTGSVVCLAILFTLLPRG